MSGTGSVNTLAIIAMCILARNRRSGTRVVHALTISREVGIGNFAFIANVRMICTCGDAQMITFVFDVNVLVAVFVEDMDGSSWKVLLSRV